VTFKFKFDFSSFNCILSTICKTDKNGHHTAVNSLKQYKKEFGQAQEN